MSIAYSPSQESDETHGPGRPKPIRLSEVGQIAAERLDGGANGALKEALEPRASDPPVTAEAEPEHEAAVRGEAALEVSDNEGAAPLPESSPDMESAETESAETRPVDVSGSGQPIEPLPSRETVEAIPLIPVSAADSDDTGVVTEVAPEEGAPQALELAPDATGDDGAEAPAAAPAADAAETMEAQVQPTDASADGPPSSAAEDAGLVVPDNRADPAPFVAPPLFSAEPTESMPSFADAPGDVHPSRPAPDVAGEESEPSPAAPGSSDPRSTDARVASALGAAAKLAADANAAAEALDNLKRLLERQMPNPRQSMGEIFAQPTAGAEPPPLPHQAVARRMPDEELPVASVKSHPRPGGRGAAARERHPFDVRGFMAGFALSWALGAALYIYLTAG